MPHTLSRAQRRYTVARSAASAGKPHSSHTALSQVGNSPHNHPAHSPHPQVPTVTRLYQRGWMARRFPNHTAHMSNTTTRSDDTRPVHELEIRDQKALLVLSSLGGDTRSVGNVVPPGKARTITAPLDKGAASESKAEI